MDPFYYKEYKDIICAINRETYDLLIWVYEEGPIEENLVDLEKRDFVELKENGILKEVNGYIIVTSMGNKIIEGYMDVIDYVH